MAGWHVGVEFSALDGEGVACCVDVFGEGVDVSSEDEFAAVVDVVDGVEAEAGPLDEDEVVVGVACDVKVADLSAWVFGDGADLAGEVVADEGAGVD